MLGLRGVQCGFKGEVLSIPRGRREDLRGARATLSRDTSFHSQRRVALEGCADPVRPLPRTPRLLGTAAPLLSGKYTKKLARNQRNKKTYRVLPTARISGLLLYPQSIQLIGKILNAVRTGFLSLLCSESHFARRAGRLNLVFAQETVEPLGAILS